MKRAKRSLVRRRRQSASTISSPTESWPMNDTRPSSSTRRVRGLPMSCSSAPKRIAWPRVSSSASGSSSSSRSRGASSPNSSSSLPSSSIARPSTSIVCP